jgi:hypothetical protein
VGREAEGASSAAAAAAATAAVSYNFFGAFF